MEKPRILIADDVPENIQILIETLKNDYSIIVANNGKKALEIAKTTNESIDLILLDIKMPEMDGFEVCQALKLYHKTKDIPVVFISILDDTDSIQKGFELGGVDYIPKPFEVKEVITRVKYHIYLSKKQRELKENLQEHKKTIAIQERLLVEREKLAYMGETVGMLAYQLKQPLASIDTDVSHIKQILTEKNETAILMDLTNKIEKNIKLANSTIDDFGDFLKPDDTIEKIYLKDIIDRSLTIIGGRLKKHNISVDLSKCKGEKYISAYPNELTQVLLHILKNGIEEMIINNIKEPKFFISICEKEDILRLEIEDNAGGVSDEMKEVIFLPGFSTKGTQGCSGLGMYISKLIIEQHCKGNMGLKDGDKGAIFYMEFPLL